MLWSGAAMGLSAAQRMIRIVLPAALPEILTGCRTGLVLALITMVTSEMIARQSGAGNILFNALDMGQYDTVYAMIIIIGAMGIGLDAAFEKMRARLVRWSEPQLRYSLELCMNARAVTTDVLLGIVPIALLVALWQATGVVRLCAGDAAAAARPGVHAPGAATCSPARFSRRSPPRCFGCSRDFRLR